jgi:hypothetical protein
MQIWNLQASFTRPNNTTAYAAGQLVANSTTAGSVAPMQFQIGGNSIPGMTRLTRVRLAKSGTTVANANFRVHLYGAQPTPANGDGGTYTTDQAANYLGNISVDMTTVPGASHLSDGAVGQGAAAAGSELLIRLQAGRTIYALIEALAAYTPAANEVFTLTLESLEAY